MSSSPFVRSSPPPVCRGGPTPSLGDLAGILHRSTAHTQAPVLVTIEQDRNTVSLGTWNPSWDGKKVVFAQKPNAADEATLYVLDVESGKRSEVDVITGAKYASPAWLPDSKSFMYEWLPVDPAIPVSERPGYCEVKLHTLGADPSKDEQIHERTGDPKTFIGGGVSR